MAPLPPSATTTKLDNYKRDTTSFDSHLYAGDMNQKTNSTFYLILRICLQQGAVGPGAAHDFGFVPGAADAAAHTYDSVAWKPNDWEKMKKKFAKDAEAFWSGKYWLQPTVAYPQLQAVKGRDTFQCNVYCRVLIYIKDAPADTHKTITVFNVVPKPGLPFRPDAANYSQATPNKVTPLVDRSGNPHRQRTLFHEVGHLLGLPHIGVTTGMSTSAAPGAPLCAVTNGAPEDLCYEGPSRGDTASVMGKGTGLSAREARPWLDRIEDHSGIAKNQWKVSMRKVPPVIQR